MPLSGYALFVKVYSVQYQRLLYYIKKALIVYCRLVLYIIISIYYCEKQEELNLQNNYLLFMTVFYG